MDVQMASDEDITKLMLCLETSDDPAEIDALLTLYPLDPRLHFMRGSLLAGISRNAEAHIAMKKAVELAPGFAIARYQLGFFELTSGEAEQALSTWGPLLTAPQDNYLRVFVEGMVHMIRDEFASAIEKFEAGLALNSENQPLNNDIRLLIGELTKLAENSATPGADDDGDHSATSLLLGQLTGIRTIN